MLKGLCSLTYKSCTIRALPLCKRFARAPCISYAPKRFNGSNIKGLSSVPKRQAPLQLRDYQEECIDTVLQHVDDGRHRLGISLATGSGKTVVFTQLIGRIAPRKMTQNRTLILVHRRELVEQAARHCSDSYPDKNIEIEMGNSHASGVADITIASVWSLVSKDRLSKYDSAQFKLVLVDEAHHVVAPSYMKVLKHFNLLKDDLSEQSPILVGVSATMSRFDGIRLSDAIDHIVYHKDYLDMIEDKWLANVIFTTVRSNADVSKVKAGPSGDFQIGELSRAVNTEESNLTTVRAWMEKASRRDSTLVFCVDVAHVMGLTAAFRREGIDAQSITGNTPKHIRGQRLEAFKTKQFSVLLNCGVFTEGTDIPNIDCILLARPTRSRNLLVQMIGRGMRLYAGKENCHIIDMVASLQTGIVTIPTLLGLDPNVLLSQTTLEAAMEANKKETVEEVEQDSLLEHQTSTGSRSKSLTFTDYDSVFDLIDDTSGERHIRGISNLAWVSICPGRWILSSEKGSYLTIEEGFDNGEPSFHVKYTIRMTAEEMEAYKTKSPYMRPRAIAEARIFSDAVHAADTFAGQRMQHKFVHVGQRWRSLPATEAQLAFINKVRPEDEPLMASEVSKGKAMEMITKIKFGARKQFIDAQVRMRRGAREESQAQRISKLRQRERVQVGPIE